MAVPANTQRNKLVIITSKWSFDVIITSLLRRVFAGRCRTQTTTQEELGVEPPNAVPVWFMECWFFFFFFFFFGGGGDMQKYICIVYIIPQHYAFLRFIIDDRNIHIWRNQWHDKLTSPATWFSKEKVNKKHTLITPISFMIILGMLWY